jgi:hypothetical protein
MDTTLRSQDIFRRYIALPQDHGSWVFLLSPLCIGLFAGGNWSIATVYLILAAFAAFLIRQPFTIAIKAYSGRRSRRDLPAAWFWTFIYALIGVAALTGLIVQGFAYLLLLALPGIPVFAWHLVLVSRRSERRQIGVELVGSGVLALAAPAAFWVGEGHPDPLGWVLFFLVWSQSAASIVYAYLRLEQRILKETPLMNMRIHMARRALLYATFNVFFVISLAMVGLIPFALLLPFGLQEAETIVGSLRPAIGVKPTRIGMRQLIVSTLFTLLFILTW